MAEQKKSFWDRMSDKFSPVSQGKAAVDKATAGKTQEQVNQERANQKNEMENYFKKK